MSERGPEINVSTEQVSKVVTLSREIARIKVLDDRSPESNERASNFLKGNFNSQYESVEQMINLSQDPGRPEDDVAKKNAKQSLDLLGSALLLAGQDKKIENWVTGAEVYEHLPSNFAGVEKILQNNLLVSGKDDEVGKKIVEQLGALEKANRRAAMAPNSYKETKERETKKTIDSLFDVYESVDSDSEAGLKIGAVVGCLDSELKGEVPVVKRKIEVDDEVDYEPIIVDPETQEMRGGARWEISPENAAMAMKFMDSSMRWQSYTPPEWFKKIKPILNKDGSIKESAEEIQTRIEYMVMVNDGAASMSYAGKDLDKVQGNKMWFAFDNEKFTKLFNEDFKLVSSKMLNDLCELYEDKNGRMSLRYKEGINKKGHQGIKASVEDKLEGIRDYKEEMADFLAKQNGRKEANYMDKMNAYTAWNLFYMFGDSSLADRTRVMPTYGGIINDGVRTLNPEYKAKSKWKVFKEEKDIFEAEYFGGSLADYALTVMRMEKELGGPIDGKKTLREKIVDGEMKIFDNKMCYGFFDFTYGTRDLCKPNGEKFTKEEDVTVSTLLMNYAKFNENGELISKNNAGDFSFGTNQVDFLNLFRDQVETAALSYDCMMGKADVKSVESWAHKIKDKVGMVRGIRINGKPTYKYTTKPDYWANMILGSFGVDTTRLSSDYIYLKTPKEIGNGYNLFLYKLLAQDLNISNADVDINSVMRYMGVKVKEKGDPKSFRLTVMTDAQRELDKKRTESLYRKLNK